MSAPRVPDVRDGLPWCSQHCPHYKNAALPHYKRPRWTCGETGERTHFIRHPCFPELRERLGAPVPCGICATTPPLVQAPHEARPGVVCGGSGLTPEDSYDNSKVRAHDERAEGEPPSGVDLIAAERARQVSVEGWDPGHDDEHDCGEMAIAAACYAAHDGRRMVVNHDLFRNATDHRGLSGVPKPGGAFDAWPWEARHDKRDQHDRKRRLVIAGALIAAEIDRLTREDGR